MQNSTSLRKAGKLFVDWAAVIVLIVSVIIFTILRGSAFFSVANLINIFRAMSTMTIFALAATVSMAPDGFDMAVRWDHSVPMCLRPASSGLPCLCGFLS